jgi:hypothetical protein
MPLQKVYRRVRVPSDSGLHEFYGRGGSRSQRAKVFSLRSRVTAFFLTADGKHKHCIKLRHIAI